MPRILRKLCPYAALEYLAKCCKLLTRCWWGKLPLLGSGSPVGIDSVRQVVVKVERIVWTEVVRRRRGFEGEEGGSGESVKKVLDGDDNLCGEGMVGKGWTCWRDDSRERLASGV